MMRRLGPCLLAMFMLAPGIGCRKNEPVLLPVVNPPPVNLLARFHWLGKGQLAADTNSAYLMSLLEMPEAVTLGNDFLAKLARSPWTRPSSGTNVEPSFTNAVGLFQPLLRTLFENESYLEIQKRTNGAPDMVLALKLEAGQADLWETNVGPILAAIPWVSPVAEDQDQHVWSCNRGGSTNYLALGRSGPWTVISLGQETNVLAADVVTRIQRNDAPFSARGTNSWLEGELDLPGLLSALSLNWVMPFPAGRIEFTTTGDGEFIRTHGQVRFPQPLGAIIEPWNIPTNMIREPLVSFGALQGVRPWLEKVKWIQELQITNVPNQFYFWAIGGSQSHTFAATPLADAANVVDRQGPGLEAQINAWLTNNALGTAEYSKDHHGISWIPVPLFTPTFQALPGGGGGILFGRLASPLPPPGKMAPQELLQRLTSRTNLIYYGWEITEPRLNQWLFMGQSARLAFRRAQMPGTATSFLFLKTAAPKLGNTVTEVLLSDPSTLSFVRKSHLGFTAVELHLLADWIESPAFPRGLHTLLESSQAMVRYNAATRSFERVTNAPAAK